MPSPRSKSSPGTSPGSLVPISLRDAVNDLKSHAQNPHTLLSTGWEIDEMVGQVEAGELVLMWARSGAGKSTWALNIVANTPTTPTVIFNMEMTARAQAEWLTCMTFNLSVPAVDIQGVMHAGADDPRFNEVDEALDLVPEVYPDTHFLAPSRPTVDDLKYAVQDIEDSTGVHPQRVFVDHLTLLADTGDYRGVLGATAALHKWGQTEGIGLYVLQQTGRGKGPDGLTDDGHRPITLSSGVYAGEADADWVYGLYRPDRNPKFKRRRWYFKTDEDYHQMLADRERLRGLVVMQVVKNRSTGVTLDDGYDFSYNAHSRKYMPRGEHEW